MDSKWKRNESKSALSLFAFFSAPSKIFTIPRYTQPPWRVIANSELTRDMMSRGSQWNECVIYVFATKIALITKRSGSAYVELQNCLETSNPIRSITYRNRNAYAAKFVIYKAVAWASSTQPVWASQMRFCSITAKYNGTLEAAHAHIDDDWYDIVECGTAGQLICDFIRSSTKL